MGLLKLTSFAKREGLLKPHKLRDCHLVIDGGHYTGWCYRETGGNYAEYVKCVKQRLHDFAECNIRCHVVFHGGHDDLKMEEKVSRLEKNITATAAGAVVRNRFAVQWNFSFLKEIMTTVMDEMKVPYVTCDDRRTDETIVALARHFNCAIMTDDSDFFISEAPCIHYRSCLRQPKTDYVRCDIFKREEFLEKYRLRKDMLSILYILLNKKTFGEKYFDDFLLEQKINTGFRLRVGGILRWLNSKHYTSALDAIMRYIPAEAHHKCHEVLKASVRLISNTNPNNFAFRILLDSRSVNISNNDRDWFEKGIATGHVPAQYVDLYYRGSLTMDQWPVEISGVVDAFRPCLRFVRYAFDLLTGFSGSRFEYVGWRGGQIDRFYLTADLSVSKPEGCSATPFGSGWDELPDYFGHFLREALPGLSSDALTALPADCRLFMLALVWWKTYAAAHYADSVVHSLLLCYLRGSVSGAREEHRRLKLFTEADRAKASAALIKLKLDDPSVEYDKRLLHAYAQFQQVLHQMNCLSQLCGAAYERTRYHEVYCGRFAYQSCLLMRERAEPLAFVAECLRGSGTVYDFYKRLQAVYEQCVEKVTLAVAPAVEGHQGGGGVAGAHTPL